MQAFDFADPKDESHIDQPSGWTDGQVEDVGGGLKCRIWRREGLHHSVQVQVSYNACDKSVSLDKYKLGADGEIINHLDHIDSATLEGVPERLVTDELMGSVAKELMRGFNPDEHDVIDVSVKTARTAYEELNRLIEETEEEDPDPLTDAIFQAHSELGNALENSH